MTELAELNTLWIGDAIHPIHHLCLLSAVKQGHRVRLFCYAPVKGVPAEVEVVSAEEVLPQSAIFKHARTGSSTPFADRFRINMINKGFGVWIDADLAFVRPLPNHPKNVFGWESESVVGNAVMGFDTGHPAFKTLLAASNDDFLIPPWFPASRRLYHSLLHTLKMPRHVRQLPYGTTGPGLLTWCVKSHQMTEEVMHKDVIYSVPYDRTFDIFRRSNQPGTTGDLPANAIAVHLWFQGLAGGIHVPHHARKALPPVETGSFLHTLAKDLGVERLIQV